LMEKAKIAPRGKHISVQKQHVSIDFRDWTSIGNVLANVCFPIQPITGVVIKYENAAVALMINDLR